jgi:hypothetical protein
MCLLVQIPAAISSRDSDVNVLLVAGTRRRKERRAHITSTHHPKNGKVSLLSFANQ